MTKIRAQNMALRTAGKVTQSGDDTSLEFYGAARKPDQLKKSQGVSVTFEPSGTSLPATDEPGDATAKLMRECMGRYPRALAKLGE